MATRLPKRSGGGPGCSPHAFLFVVLSLSIACGTHTSPAHRADVPAAADSSLAGPTWCVAQPLRSAESEHGVVGPLADINSQFLQAHARARDHQCSDLEKNRLVLRYSFGVFEARYKGQEVTHQYILPKEYHPVKDVSHAVYLSALLFAEPAGQERVGNLARALSALDSALAELRDPGSPTATLLPPRFFERELRLLQRTRDAVASFAAERLGSDGQKAYFESVRSDVNDNLRDIAVASLQELHRAVESTRTRVAAFDPSAWESALVVVGVMHQARAREIGIQYFERLLGERAGEGARNERRMVVAEHMTAPADQLGLLAAHLVDEGGAAAVFGDPLRLQWDALGDLDARTLDLLFKK